MRGIDLLLLPPHRFVNYTWAAIMEHADAKTREQIIIDLESPLGDEEPDDGAWSEEEMGADFLKAMGSTSLGASKASDPTIGEEAAKRSAGNT